MAHEKVYGICENKCQVEVPSKSEYDYYAQSVIPGMQDAIASHASDIRYINSSEIPSIKNDMTGLNNRCDQIVSDYKAADNALRIYCQNSDNNLRNADSEIRQSVNSVDNKIGEIPSGLSTVGEWITFLYNAILALQNNG